MSNSIDPDETAHYEPSHLDLRCLHKPYGCIPRWQKAVSKIGLKDVFWLRAGISKVTRQNYQLPINISKKSCHLQKFSNTPRIYSRLSLSRVRLSRITAYLEVKIWSLFKHEHFTVMFNR